MAFEILSRGITLDQLQVFTRVIETGSLMAAAGGEKSLQTSYSRRIKALEDAVEKKLFTRAGRALRLTEDGRKLAVLTNAFFASLEEFAFGMSAKTIRVGSGGSVFETFVYPRFKMLREAMPAISFEFIGLSTTEIAEALSSGQIEFGIVRGDAELIGCVVLPLGEMEFELVVPRKLLPQGEIAAISQIDELPIATLTGHGRFATSLEKLAEEEGLNLHIVAKADSFVKVAHLSQTADLAAFLPKQFVGEFPGDRFSRYRTAAFDMLSRSIVLAVSKNGITLRPALDKIFRQIAQIVRVN